MSKGAGRAGGVARHVGASGAKRDAHHDRARNERDRLKALYDQGERRGDVLAAWEKEPVDPVRYDNSWRRGCTRQRQRAATIGRVRP